MGLIEFSQDLVTGVEDMDREHRELLGLFNRIYGLMKAGRKEEAREFFIKELTSYVETHLRHEEEFMESIDYPELEKHKRLHITFRKVVYQLREKLESGDAEAFRQALAVAWGWIHTHIKNSDRRYGEYARRCLK